MSVSSQGSAASSSASDDREEHEAFKRDDQRMRAVALGAGVHPDHVDKVLGHYAKTLAKHMDAGDVDPDMLTDAHHGENIRRILRDNPTLHVHAKAPEPTGAHADHENFAPGKMDDTTARAALKKRGINYR